MPIAIGTPTPARHARSTSAVPPGLGSTLSKVEARIGSTLRGEASRWRCLDASLEQLPDLLDAYVRRGGKRLRPSFLAAGVVAAGGDPEVPAVIDLGAALELLHAFALIHDDVMDGSTTRRGLPALHVDLEAGHRRARGRGEARRYGEGLAVLAGDLALVYADRLVPADPAIRAVWDELRVELTMGQCLDVLGAGLGTGTPERSRLICTLKSGRYTVVRPLHLAAEVTGRPDLMASFTRFGDPLGRAFQLRDDVLGVFGAPEATGKPAGDDLQEAKPTVLLETCRRRAIGAQREVLDVIGRRRLSPEDIDRIREVVVATGSLAAVEDEIEREAASAVQALATAPVTAEGRTLLGDLADFVVRRDR
jgi:geranylgeranyl diphosphate synthase type I